MLVDERKDYMALAVIFQAVPEAMMMVLAEHETAKEAWDILKEMHVGADRVKEARAQTLMSEFDVMCMKETESIKDFAMKLTTIVNEIRVLGDKMEERTVVKKFLRAMPDKFLPIVSTIEQFADMKTMTIVEVVGRLKAYEERTKGQRRDAEGEHLLLTRDEWESRSNKEGANNSGMKNRKFDKAKIRCYNCQDYGHFASECRNPRKERAEAHLIVTDVEDEPALL